MVKVTGYNYVGRVPANSQDLVTKLAVLNLVNSATPSQISAASDVTTAAALKAGRAYVDTQAATFASRAYYQSQDALNLPLSKVGQPGGGASLDATGKIPMSQIPPVGAGYVLGPFGPTTGYAVSTGSTPVKVCDWDIGIQSLTFEPWVFCSILAEASNMGRPVIEVGISNGATTLYSEQVIIGRGVGRTFWNDAQVINVMPVPANNGQTGPDPTVYVSTYHVFCSAWLHDTQGETVAVEDQGVLSGAVFLVRTQL